MSSAPRRPGAVIVQGDTNTASAAAQAANYAGVPLPIHVEAGLRWFDRAMPEEINRCLAGVLADLIVSRRLGPSRICEPRACPAGKMELTGSTVVEATPR